MVGNEVGTSCGNSEVPLPTTPPSSPTAVRYIIYAHMVFDPDDVWDFAFNSYVADMTRAEFTALLERDKFSKRLDRFPARKARLLAHYQITDTDAASFREADWSPVIDMDELTSAIERLRCLPVARVAAKPAVPLTGPVSQFPAEEPSTQLDSVEWGFGTAGPSTSPRSKPVRTTDPKRLLDTIEAPIIDLDNRATRKVLAKYKRVSKVKTPKEDREKLIKQMRDFKLSQRHGFYETQMFGLRPGVTVHHRIDPQAEEVLTHIVNNFKDVMNNGYNTAGDLVDKIKESVDKVNNTADGLLGVVKDMFEKGLSAITKLFWIVPLLGAAYYMVVTSSNDRKVFFTGAFATAFALLLPEGLWDHIKSLWPEAKNTSMDNPMETQSGITINSLAHMLTLGMSYMTVGTKDYMGVTQAFVKMLPNYTRTLSGWKELSSFVINIIEGFINHLRVSFGADRIRLFKVGNDKIDNWCSRVMAKVNASQTGERIMTPESIREIQSLRHEGTVLTDAYRMNSESTTILHRYLAMLDDLCRTCSAAMHMARGTRAPPVVLALSGKPGVGKTWLTKAISDHVLTTILTEERAKQLNDDLSCEIFQKGATEYWNGYCNQKVVIMDDFGQSVPVPGVDNDYMDLIRMANCWAYPLNFADLENKGKNFFESEFLILTTNLDNISSCQKVIMEPEAVTRRIDFGYKISVAPGWNIGEKIDMMKVRKYMLEHEEVPWHAWQVIEHKFTIGNRGEISSNKVQTLGEVLGLVTDRLKTNKMYHSDTTDIFKKIVRKRYETQFGYNFDLVNETHDTWAHFYKRTQEYVEYLARDPLIQFLTVFAVGALFATFIGSIIRTVVSWFSSVAEIPRKIYKALAKKKSIPEVAIADMIDAVRPSDFEQVREVDGRFEVVPEFTGEVFKRAYERVTGKTVTQSNTPDGPKFVKTVIQGARVYQTDMETQSDFYGDGIADVAFGNVFQMKLRDSCINTEVGQILFYKDTCAIMPAHFDHELKMALSRNSLEDDAVVELVSAKNPTYMRSFPVQAFLKFDRYTNTENDFCMVKFPRDVRAQRDISGFFLKESDLSSVNHIRLRLDTIDGNKTLIHRSRFMNAIRSDGTKVDSMGCAYTLVRGYEYVGYTRKGDCGGVVCLEEAPEKQGRRIIGIHVAGETSLNVGLTNVLTQEFLCAAERKLGVTSDQFYVNQMGLPLCDPPLEGSFMGWNKSEKTHNMNPVTCIAPTPLRGAWGRCLRRPVPLRPFIKDGIRIYPMKQALLPYATPVVNHDAVDVARAVYHVFKRLNSLTVDSYKGQYTFEQACAGIDGTTINGIPRGTSPGYPYIFDGLSNKKIFFGKGDKYSFDSQECADLKLRVEEILDAARKGIRSEHVFVDFLKDELRSEEKASNGMARLISASPLAYVVAFRMMFLAFTDAVQNTRIRNGVAVGINAYTEWDYLAKTMSSKGPYCVAGDFKGFDSSEQPSVHWGILDGINSWYNDGEENARIRNILWMEVVHSRHLGGVEGKADTIYQWNKSLPSGHPATSIINSLYNLVLFNMVWTDIMGIDQASQFWNQVAIVVYGDDNILNIHPHAIDRFNQTTITSAMTKRGMTYTSEDKSSDVAAHRRLEEITFLKRSFRFDDILNKYVGPQDLDSILYVPYWCKDKAYLRTITEGNLEFTYSELSLHEPSVWETYAPRIKEAAVELMQLAPQQMFTREEYLRLSQVKTMVWPL